MVRSKGFEPLTFWFVAKHSIQLSYERVTSGLATYCKKKWWLQRESNQRHRDFQSLALPTELWSQMAVPTGLEPAIFCVTGRRVNQLHQGTKIGCGKRIWTSDLRVMSPTSYQTAPSRDIMAEEKGFEPLRRLHDLPVFKTGPFNQTWVFLQIGA